MPRYETDALGRRALVVYLDGPFASLDDVLLAMLVEYQVCFRGRQSQMRRRPSQDRRGGLSWRAHCDSFSSR